MNLRNFQRKQIKQKSSSLPALEARGQEQAAAAAKGRSWRRRVLDRRRNPQRKNFCAVLSRRRRVPGFFWLQETRLGFVLAELFGAKGREKQA